MPELSGIFLQLGDAYGYKRQDVELDGIVNGCIREEAGVPHSTR